MAKLTRTELENHLWKSADILRGSIDSSDYKIYIFGFLFLKRLSDRFEEEAKESIRQGLPENVAYSDPDEHEFFLVERARWSSIKKLTTGIGDHLNKACAAIEDANPSIEGVLANIDFNSESRLGDAKNREGVLSRLIDHFSRIDLSNASLSEPDMLGRAYEYLIDKFADDAGKKGGEFYPPPSCRTADCRVVGPQARDAYQ
ncbi:type I restriction-modification system, M subunit [Brucella vulpis]|nr:type I restriction-modification system, M subunit [Brucella vulpis]CUW51380.1 type I restriction-modification system, M subunit [Brucella vulpis]